MRNNIQHIQLTDKLLKATRAFFSDRKFSEVIPSVLSNAIPNEPNIYPFATSWHKNAATEIKYLSTSPERSLKTALGLGVGNCYAVGHSFRNLEDVSPLHSPEFLMLEWYRENSTYHKIMDDVKEYVTSVSREIGHPLFSSQNSWKTISLKEQYEKILDVSYEKLLTDDEVMFTSAKTLGYGVTDCTWRQIFDQVLVNEVEANLPSDPVFLVDFPSRISPLCKKQSDAPHIVERFELYIGGVEIANGNDENTDAAEIREVFEKETGEGRSPVDTQFLNVLKVMNDSGNRFAGVGLGLDRLLMVLTGESGFTEWE